MLKNTSVFNGNIINSNIDKDTLSQLNMGYSDGQMTSGYSNAVEKLAISYNEATAEANALRMAQDGLSKSTTEDILAKQNWSKVEIDAAVSTQTFKNAQISSIAATTSDTTVTWANVVATKALTAAKKALSVVGGIAFATAISFGISALVKFADSLITTKKELRESAETAKQTIDDIKESFDNLEDSTNNIKKRYAELAQGVEQLSGKNLTLSDDDYKEFLNFSNQLANLFPTLTKNYDENGNAILDLSGDVSNIVSSLDDLIERQRQLSNKEMLENLPSIYGNYKNTIDDYSKELEKARQKQEDYLNTYKQLKNAEYDVSEDKKAVTFHFGNISEEEKSKVAKELTSSFDDLNDYIIQDIGTLDNHDTTITLYLDKEFDGFEARLQSAQEEINKYTSKIKTEVSSFSKYMNTWLQGNWLYQKQDETMQKALQQVLFNKDWINIAESELGEDAEWEDISKWIEEKYISAINNISNEEIKQEFLDLFTADLTPQAKLDLAQKLQEYFDNNNILVSLDFILNPDDQNSTQNIVDRFNASITKFDTSDPEGYKNLAEYTKSFSEDQMNHWLEVTDGIDNANVAIHKFEKSLEKISNVDFFTDGNLEAIDEYRSKISNLSGYLEKINTEHKLSSEDLAELNLTYGISANTLEEYKQAIIAEMNEAANNSDIMIILAEAINTCNDAVLKSRLESLYESLQNINIEAQKAATSFKDLRDAISTLESSASLLRDLKEEMDKTGRIDISYSDDILDAFPEMSDEVALFNAGLMDSEELFAKLEQAYQSNADEYADTIESELQHNEEFYDHIMNNLEDWVLNMAEAYDINLTDYKTLNEEKLALDKEYARRKAILDEALLKNEAMNDVLQSPESKDFTGKDFRRALNTHEGYLVAQSDLENIQAIIDAVDTAFTTDVSWETFGKTESDSGSDSDNNTEIDWADQSLKVLQDEVDKFQNAFNNTKGLENQINAIDDLNGALIRLKGGYETAYEKYKTRYDNAIKGLGEDIRKKIESGEEFDLSIYDSDTANDIQTATDNFNKMAEAEEKVKELSNEIDFNTNIEKSKLLQQSYELQLETINTKLEDQTLSVDEKNDLLDKQLKLQNAINELLREQAKYEEDYETISKLNAEDKNNKLQNRLNKLQNKKDQNQVYIDTYNAALEDTSLTSDEINALNNSLESATNRDFKYQFKEIIKKIDTQIWEDYISALKEKYSEQDMSDKKFIKKHLGEISNYFNYTGMEELYYEYLNSGKDFKTKDYETKKNERSYYINDAQNDIQDIQNDIELQGGRGTEIQYKNLESLYSNTKNYWIEQKADAEAMLRACKEGTAEWDKWNNEVQECDNNIQKCNSGIKDCQISILKLPLNEIEDSLRDIENKLRDINRDLDDQNDLIAAATGILDNEIYTQEILKEAVQDKIDKLEKENDLRQANLNIQKAEYELEKLKNQRSSKIFKEGKGWVYESDQSEIREAQYNLDNAKYEHKLALLNDHVTVLDEEIDRLNKIKDRWSRITTEAENLVLINKALLYDSKFVGKVLEEDSSLMVGISSIYSSLLQQKTLYEDQQEDYTTLQDIINDTAEMYKLEGISYEEAKQRIKNAIVQYYPEIVSNYENEEEVLERVATKKLEDAGITEETSVTIEEVVKKSNKKLLKSYKKLSEGLDEVFGQLNGMLSTYEANTQAMVSTISASIESLRNQLASVQSGVNSVTITTEATEPVESSSSKSKKKKNTKKAGKSHSGLELGYIGETSTSKDKKAFEYIALSELKDDELVRVLQRGEAVLTESQISQVMSNFRKLTQVKVPNIIPNNSQTNQSVNFNGDIVVQGVQDTNSLAKAIRNNLPSAMLQELYK